MKVKLRLVAVLVASAAGAAVGIFWIVVGLAPGSAYNPYWDKGFVREIAFASCPFIALKLQPLSIVVVPLLNAIIYASLVYVISRFAKRPGIPAAIVLPAAMGVFWVIAIDAARNHADWPPNWGSWRFITCPFIPLIGQSGLLTALVPMLNALYGFGMYFLLSMMYRRFRRTRSL